MRGTTLIGMDVMETAFISESTFDRAGFLRWLAKQPSEIQRRSDLIEGRIVMSPPSGFVYSRVGMHAAQLLANHVRDRALGIVLGADGGGELPAGSILGPDVTVILSARVPPDAAQRAGIPVVVPHLVVEVITPSSRERDTVVKRRLYAQAGVDEFWLVDQDDRTITILHRGPDGAYDAGDVFRVGDTVRSRVLPELAAPVESVLVVE